MNNWLTHNPVADLYGPHFLVLYAAVILGTLLLCGILRSFTDPTAGSAPPPVPAVPDPYEIAFLRGGLPELARAVIFRLLQAGYLETDVDGNSTPGRPPGLIRQSAPAPGWPELEGLERELFSWFRSGLTPTQVFQSDYLGRLERYARQYEARLHEQALLTTPAQGERLARLWCAGMLAIGGLGGYKLLMALSRGKHNVGFLILMLIVGTVLLTVLCYRTGRLSARGQDYLMRLQLAFKGLRSSTASGQLPTSPGMDHAALLLMGVFGATALGNTAYSYYPAMFRQSGGGGCGAMGGSGCGSGGSCGGGGGCGGGGCGGCGGG